MSIVSHSRIIVPVGTVVNTRIPSGDTTVPTTPGTPSVTAISSTQLNLTWTASTDASGIAFYTVERSPASAGTWVVQITIATNAFNDSTVVASTAYDYRIKAQDPFGNVSSYSSTGTGTTLAGGGADSDVPTAPVLGTPVVVNSTSITVPITTISTDSSGILGYNYLISTSSGGTYSVASTQNPATSYTYTGLTAGTQYFFKVRAVDNSGSAKIGNSSNIVNATTQAVGGVLLYDGNYEIAGSFLTNNFTVTQTNPLGGSNIQYRSSINTSASGDCRVDFQTTVKLDGTSAQKSECNYRDSHTYRGEITHLNAPRPPLQAGITTYWYSFSVMCPDDENYADGIDSAIFQLHSTVNIPGALKLLKPSTGGYTECMVVFVLLDKVAGKKTYILGTKATLQPRGAWVRWTFKFDWTTATTGGLEIYRNGVLIQSDSGIKTLSTEVPDIYAPRVAEPPFPKLGCYKYPWQYTPAASITIRKQIIYHDAFRVGTSFNAVQP